MVSIPYFISRLLIVLLGLVILFTIFRLSAAGPAKQRTGALVLLYAFWTAMATFLWWFCLALGIGDSFFQYSPLTEPIVHIASGLSIIALVIGVIALLIGGVALTLQKAWGRWLSMVGLWGMIVNALLLDVGTFLWNVESGGTVFGFLSGSFVVFAATALYVVPSLPLFKRMQRLR